MVYAGEAAVRGGSHCVWGGWGGAGREVGSEVVICREYARVCVCVWGGGDRWAQCLTISLTISHCVCDCVCDCKCV